MRQAQDNPSGRPQTGPVSPSVPAPRCLVVGSYPPVPGPAAAATVAAVRRAWAGGQDVVVVSPRPSAAPFVLPSAGARGIARDMVRLGRRHACDQVVLCIEPAWPKRRRTDGGTRSLAGALSSFRHAEVVVTGEVGGDWGHLARLWGAADLLTAGSEELAASLRAAGAPSVRACEPYQGARPRPSPFPPGTVSPLEHDELLVRVRARRRVGAVARKVLGRRAPAVRAQLERPLRWARRRRRGPTARRRPSKPRDRRANA